MCIETILLRGQILKHGRISNIKTDLEASQFFSIQNNLSFKEWSPLTSGMTWTDLGTVFLTDNLILQVTWVNGFVVKEFYREITQAASQL